MAAAFATDDEWLKIMKLGVDDPTAKMKSTLDALSRHRLLAAAQPRS
jgi:hypothetical protein